MMIFKNILLGAVLIAATAFAQPADSTTKKDVASLSSKVTATEESKTNNSSLKKQQAIAKLVKPATTWSKIKDLFE